MRVVVGRQGLSQWGLSPSEAADGRWTSWSMAPTSAPTTGSRRAIKEARSEPDARSGARAARGAKVVLPCGDDCLVGIVEGLVGIG